MVVAKVASPSVAVDAAAPSPPRTVRVRLADGSQVVGQVHAEQATGWRYRSTALLGQLAIPRSRISTLAYDAAAAGAGSSAPVQQLDDDERLPPRKRAAAPAAAQP